MFGFLELENDPEVLHALVQAAEAWLRDHGRDRMVGPMDFTQNDEIGILVEGFERPPMIRQPWHPPYYAELLEGEGLAKEVDLLMWELHISGKENVLPVIWELADKLEPEHGIRLRRMSRRTLRRDLDVFGEIYNEAWSRNWGFVPFSKTDLDAYAQEMHLVFDPDWFMVAEREDGEAVGAAITVPDVNQVLKRMNGRLLPARLAALPAPAAHHRSVPGRLPRGQARVPAHGRGRGALRGALPDRRAEPRQVGRDGLDPRDEHPDEPRHGGDGRQDREAIPDLRRGRSDARIPGYTRRVSELRSPSASPSTRPRSAPCRCSTSPGPSSAPRSSPCPPPWPRPPAASSSEWPPSCSCGCSAARAPGSA